MTDPTISSKQSQFLDVIDPEEAKRRLHAAIDLSPRGCEEVTIDEAFGRVLSADVRSEIDVPSFDRSNLDGFAVRAVDTYGAEEEIPVRLTLNQEVIATAVVPKLQVDEDTASTIATGGMLPRGADSIVMVEHTDLDGDAVLVRKSVTPGFGVTFAGTDVARGETILRRGQTLTSRETGVLAAIGRSKVRVFRRPIVAIISTGDEIIQPGDEMQPGMVFDSNARIIADAVHESGGFPKFAGIVRDDVDKLRVVICDAIENSDVVLLSGGTSKGAGDISYHVVSELTDPGIVAHGVALKPGKPICLAASQKKPVVILPGFPTSAIFTFHEFVAPIIRQLSGRAMRRRREVTAKLAVKVNSTVGRKEFLLVNLVPSEESSAGLVAYPMGKGSGSVTTFSNADGFIRIDQHQELVQENETVGVTLLGDELRPADLVVIGSHCTGLDYLLGKIHDLGFQTKFIAVGSTGGLQALRRGECDLAGIHLLDEATKTYNRPFLDQSDELISGYARMQGVVYRKGDDRFEGKSVEEVVQHVAGEADCVMVNRNLGSGTRFVIDQLLRGAKPNGYAVQARSHNAVVAAIAQTRADWGVAIEPVVDRSELGFTPIGNEQFDFALPRSRSSRPAVQAFKRLLQDVQVRDELRKMGFE